MKSAQTETATFPSGHFVYMLRCQGGRIYTGYATNVAARYTAHCTGKGARFTRAFPPESILCIFNCFDKSSALRLEAALKTLPKKAKEQLAHFSRLENPIPTPPHLRTQPDLS